jgi:exodeoxyribonuclease-3
MLISIFLMRIISYNVNGIRAALPRFSRMVQHANPDVICLQKLRQLKIKSQLMLLLQQVILFNITIQLQKGYSGVAILSKIKPYAIFLWYGEHMDFEGRNLRADFYSVSVMSLYLPSGTNMID